LASALLLPRSITWANPAESFDPKYLANLHAAGISIQGIDRFRGILGNPNAVGGLMLITVGPALVCWRGATQARKVLLASLMIIAAALALEADSRSPFVGLALGCGLYVLWQYRGRGAAWLAAFVILVLIAGSVGGGLSSHFARGEVTTLTGRTDVWAFAIQKIWQRPLTGYGYEVNGSILNNKYFPIWYGPWDLGPHSSLHDGYLAVLVGVGIPATALWLFIVLRPWVFLFRQKDDPWGLKPMALLVVLPLLVLNLTEVVLGDFGSAEGVLFGLAWALGERYRELALAQIRVTRQKEVESLPSAAKALFWQAV
jgi:O-antigen ligase